MQYALITRALQDTGKRKVFSITPPGPSELADTKPYWVPYTNTLDDQSVTSETITEAPVTTVYADRVETIRVRRDLTAQELDTKDTNAVNSLASVNSLDRAQFQMIFQMYNEIRDLRSRSPITVQQFKDYLKGLIR